MSADPFGARERDRWAIPVDRAGRHRVIVDPTSPAEELPALYRAILDRVAELETGGDRAAARRVRREATAAYSRAWDERARRSLLSLLRDASRPTIAERRLGRGIRRSLPRLGRPVPPAVVSDR